MIEEEKDNVATREGFILILKAGAPNELLWRMLSLILIQAFGRRSPASPYTTSRLAAKPETSACSAAILVRISVVMSISAGLGARALNVRDWPRRATSQRCIAFIFVGEHSITGGVYTTLLNWPLLLDLSCLVIIAATAFGSVIVKLMTLFLLRR